MIHTENVRKDGEAIYLIWSLPASNAELSLHEGLLVVLFDGKERYEDFSYLLNDNCLVFNWYRNPPPVYLTINQTTTH